MGAWIEILRIRPVLLEIMVAPFMGAWIEIGGGPAGSDGSRVAPFMGAWIEIRERIDEILLSKSHPLWVRGLK